MKIGGLQKVSLIDYPGLICAIVFSQGCNFRCPYCHNPELVEPRLFRADLPEKDVLDFLSTRRGKLDAVSITGGEPTLQGDLQSFIVKLKKMGFAIKLDTNGSQPEVIKTLLAEKLLDFIALDVKGPLEKYSSIINAKIDSAAITASIKLVLKSGIPYEFRTTVVKSQLTEKDLTGIAKMLRGADKFILQQFVPVKTLDKKFLKENSYSSQEWEKIKKRLEKEIPSVIVR
ncbi:MAG TPA: anaerobic ribonucleoside-triphosphate reductase activating protein [Smithellaceae bacterium]|nr:anaerobic ribonucleoside-triphosphate reductase activating protein [Smithellaceae bacterium]